MEDVVLKQIITLIVQKYRKLNISSLFQGLQHCWHKNLRF